MASTNPPKGFAEADGSEANHDIIPTSSNANTVNNPTTSSGNASRQHATTAEAADAPVPTHSNAASTSNAPLATISANSLSAAMALIQRQPDNLQTSGPLQVPNTQSGRAPLPASPTLSKSIRILIAGLIGGASNPAYAHAAALLAFNPGNPDPGLHNSWEPHATHTTVCDVCNKKNARNIKGNDPRNVMQRCTICNLQWCHDCITAGRSPTDHYGNYAEMNWDGGEGLQPPRQRKRKRGEGDGDDSDDEESRSTPSGPKPVNSRCIKSPKKPKPTQKAPSAPLPEPDNNATDDDPLVKDEVADDSHGQQDTMNATRQQLQAQRPVQRYPHPLHSNQQRDLMNNYRPFGAGMRPYPSVMYPQARRYDQMYGGFGFDHGMGYPYSMTGFGYSRLPLSYNPYVDPPYPDQDIARYPVPPNRGQRPAMPHLLESGDHGHSANRIQHNRPAPRQNTNHMDVDMPERMHNSHDAASSRLKTSNKDEQKSAEKESDKKFPGQSEVARFRQDVQAEWEHNDRLLSLQRGGRLDEALTEFQGMIVRLGRQRTISEDDVAEIFQRVTSEEIRAVRK